MQKVIVILCVLKSGMKNTDVKQSKNLNALELIGFK